jgi:hypothetical protein
MSILKNIILGASTFGVGTFLGYFICKKKLQEQYRADVVDIQNFYSEKLSELGVMEEDFEIDED